MNYLQWLMFSLFFGMGFGAGYLRGIEVGKVIGYRRWRDVSRHVSNKNTCSHGEYGVK